jgi:hypothetical protein
MVAQGHLRSIRDGRAMSVIAVEKGFGILVDIPADHPLRRMNRVVGQLICASAFARSTSAERERR